MSSASRMRRIDYAKDNPTEWANMREWRRREIVSQALYRARIERRKQRQVAPAMRVDVPEPLGWRRVVGAA